MFDFVSIPANAMLLLIACCSFCKLTGMHDCMLSFDSVSIPVMKHAGRKSSLLLPCRGVIPVLLKLECRHGLAARPDAGSPAAVCGEE